jgi:hypothetical protein
MQFEYCSLHGRASQVRVHAVLFESVDACEPIQQNEDAARQQSDMIEP